MVTKGVVLIQPLQVVVNVTGPSGKSAQGCAPVELQMVTQLRQEVSDQRVLKPSRLFVEGMHGGIGTELRGGTTSVVQVLTTAQVI